MLREWGKERTTLFLHVHLVTADAELPRTMVRRAQIVVAAGDAAHSGTIRVIWVTASASLVWWVAE
jgi:hypothetical protein